MKHLRYYSGFYSRDNIPYRIEIWQESETDFDPVRIVLSSDPVEIEWAEVDKLEPVHSSSATLNMVSMSDRFFADLYAVEPGAIRLDILRKGELYWSGTLDTELFEEPYSYKDRYITTVTFSDFAILDRLDWQERGIKTMSEVLEICLDAAGFKRGSVEEHITTRLPGKSTYTLLEDCSLMCENFFDEDDEPSSIREVLDEMLRPFALRLKQKNGKLLLYDINGIYDTAPTPVCWRGTDAMLGVEPVYNKVTITFSPYATGTLLDGTLDPDEVLPEKPIGASGELIYTERNSGTDGFRITYDQEASSQLGKMTLMGGACPFRIDAEFSGSNAAGVMWGFRPGDYWRGLRPTNALADDNDALASPDNCVEIIETPRVHVLDVRDANRLRYKIKVSLNVLFDVRYNPFEQASYENEEGNWDDFKNWVNYGYIPVMILLYDDKGAAKYYYYNNNIRWSHSYVGSGSWQPLSGSVGSMEHISWLSFYDQSDRKSNTGFGGWQGNKRALGWYSGGLSSQKSLDGELLPAPPISGYIKFMVYSGVWYHDNDADRPYRAALWDKVRWLLYKDPKIEVVKSNGNSVNEEDVKVSAWINKQAKESLDISTIIGTAKILLPSGRGYILRTSDSGFAEEGAGSVIQTFYRAGETASLEQLLAGTVYSNYARRMSTLSGTIALEPSAEVLSDASSGDAKYVLLSEIQSLGRETSEIKMAEIAPDSFTGIEYDKK